jgi:hypothetical protein
MLLYKGLSGNINFKTKRLWNDTFRPLGSVHGISDVHDAVNTA